MRMGCCFSCNEEDENQDGETGERTQLLRDPVSNSTPVVRVPPSDSVRVGTGGEGDCVGGQEDELARILQETAAAMIDVSGSGSHSLDQREFQERSRHYLQKIQTLSPTLLLPPNNTLLADVPNPEKQLGAPAIPKDDLLLMEWAMGEVEEALLSIRVEYDEDLVVPFGPHPTQSLDV